MSRDEAIVGCVLLLVSGTLALIASGICGDHGLPKSGTALAVVGVCFFAAVAAIWWRDGR